MTQTTLSAVQQKVRDSFNFTVDKFPLAGPDGLKTPWYGMFRSDNFQVVGSGSVTSRYLPHQTEDVVALVDAASLAFEGGVADLECHFSHGHHVFLQPSKEYRKSIFGTADNIFPRIIINASYDAKCFSASMGFYRDACRNMSILRQVSGTTVSIKHTSALRGKMDSLIERFSVLRESWGTLATVIESMQSQQVNMVTFLNAVYGEPEADSGRSVTIHRNRTEAIFRRLTDERLKTGRGKLASDWMVSGWEAYNAVQGYTQHEASRKGKPSSIARVISAMNDPAVARAESLLLATAV